MAISDWLHKKEKLPQQTEAELRLHRCAFTGHRPERICGAEASIIAGLRKEILAAIDDGYTTFITGCSRGVDLWAADIILELRRNNKSLKLICAVQFEGFESKWSTDWIKHYGVVRRQADLVIIISPEYSIEAYQIRNMWLCNHASRLIAVCDGRASGTMNTVNYAERLKISIHLIAPRFE